MTIRKQILESIKNPKYIPILLNGHLTFSLLCENQEIQEKKRGERLFPASQEEEVDLNLHQSLLNSVLSSSTTLKMLGMFASESDSEFESEFESESESSPTQDLKMKDVDTSSSSRLVYKNPPCKYHVGESSYTFCVICDEVAPNRALVESNKCNHSFCKECICIYIGEKIQENIGKVKCPKPKCKAVLEPYFFRQIIPEEVFWRWADALAESSVLYWQTYLDCPFEDCEERFVDDERGFKIRACPKCWRLFCVVCKTGWHMGKSCLEFQMELEAERARQRHRRKRIVWSESDYGGLKVLILE